MEPIITGEEQTGEEMIREFIKLRMTFPVYCKFPICRLKVGQLVETWTNNYVVPQKIIRRLRCGFCSSKYLLFSW